MSTYAIVECGGKQYRVEEGQSFLVDRMPDAEGAKVALRPVMLRTDSDVVLDAKGLEKVKVEAKIAAHERGEKIKVFKYKAKKGYRKHQGYRSELTRLEVTEVKLMGRKPAASAKAESAEPTKAAAKPATEEAAEKAPVKKPAAKAAAKPATKPAAKKTPAKPAAAKKPAAKKPAAKKPAAAKKPDSEKESD